MNSNQKKKIGFVFALILLVHMILILAYGMKKEGYHEDEYYSFWSSAGYAELMPRGYYDWRTGPELMEQFYVRPGDEFNFEAVIYNQIYDSHPPLYHLSLNVIMSLFPGRLYKWLGIGLNALYSLASLVGVTFLFYHIGEEKHREQNALVAAALYAIGPSVISSVMFIRMYAMTSMLNVWYACALLMAVKNLGKNKKKFAVWTILGAAICYMSLLTHYFCLLLPGVLTVFACIYVILKRKNILQMALYGISMLAGIGLAVLSYSEAVRDILYDYRGNEVRDALHTNDFAHRFRFFSGLLNKEAFGGMLPVICIVLVLAMMTAIVLIVRHWKLLTREERSLWYIYGSLIVSCVISALVLIKISLFLNDGCRYFYPVLALFIPLAGCFVIKVARFAMKYVKCNIFSKQGAVFGILAVFVLMVPYLAGHMRGEVKFLYESEAEKIAFAEEYKEYPLVLLCDRDNMYRTWFRADQIWSFHNIFYTDYEHIMVDTFDEPTIQSADKLVVFMDAPVDAVQKLVAINPNLDTYRLIRHDEYYYVYLLE